MCTHSVLSWKAPGGIQNLTPHCNDFQACLQREARTSQGLGAKYYLPRFPLGWDLNSHGPWFGGSISSLPCIPRFHSCLRQCFTPGCDLSGSSPLSDSRASVICSFLRVEKEGRGLQTPKNRRGWGPHFVDSVQNPSPHAPTPYPQFHCPRFQLPTVHCGLKIFKGQFQKEISFKLHALLLWPWSIFLVQGVPPTSHLVAALVMRWAVTGCRGVNDACIQVTLILLNNGPQEQEWWGWRFRYSLTVPDLERKRFPK